MTGRILSYGDLGILIEGEVVEDTMTSYGKDTSGKMIGDMIAWKDPLTGLTHALSPGDPRLVRRSDEDRRDPVVEKVRADLLRRSQVGIEKYGTTLADNQGDETYWLRHAYEEALDLANYLAKLIMEREAQPVGYPFVYADEPKEPKVLPGHAATCDCTACRSLDT